MRAELPATSETKAAKSQRAAAGEVGEGANVEVGDAERLSDPAQTATFHLHSRAADLPEQVAGP